MSACWNSSAVTRVGMTLALIAVIASDARASDSEDAWIAAAEANARLELWDYGGAGALIDRMESLYPQEVATLFVRGKQQFHSGQYAAAVATLDRALAVSPDVEPVRRLRDLVAETMDVVSDFATYTTSDGLFEIRYDASRDEVLIPWAEETLESAYYEIGYDLGYWPEPPIRVEIYPRARTLARVSSLTEEAIEGSGTIALCKYGKLMFTSPRASLRGYEWRTTLSHEYVHYVVGHLTMAELPIWLHEALAKYLESRWTGSREASLGPHREALLTERIGVADLITFEQMHPSMAYLPTPEDASTAYAEVFTVMEYLVERRGSGVIRDLLRALRDGASVEGAFEAVVGEPFDVFESNWMRYLVSRPSVVIPGDFDDEIQLMPEESGDEAVDRWAGVASVEARDYLHIGELLRARDLPAAAIAEYEKAELILGSANPLLQNALARAYLDVSRPGDARAALADVARWHPGFYRTHLHLGEAAIQLNEHDVAVALLVRAGGINPFDPAVHSLLATAYAALGDTESADRHRRYARLVEH